MRFTFFPIYAPFAPMPFRTSLLSANLSLNPCFRYLTNSSLHTLASDSSFLTRTISLCPAALATTLDTNSPTKSSTNTITTQTRTIPLTFYTLALLHSMAPSHPLSCIGLSKCYNQLLRKESDALCFHTLRFIRWVRCRSVYVGTMKK